MPSSKAEWAEALQYLVPVLASVQGWYKGRVTPNRPMSQAEVHQQIRLYATTLANLDAAELEMQRNMHSSWTNSRVAATNATANILNSLTGAASVNVDAARLRKDYLEILLEYNASAMGSPPESTQDALQEVQQQLGTSSRTNASNYGTALMGRSTREALENHTLEDKMGIYSPNESNQFENSTGDGAVVDGYFRSMTRSLTGALADGGPIATSNDVVASAQAVRNLWRHNADNWADQANEKIGFEYFDSAFLDQMEKRHVGSLRLPPPPTHSELNPGGVGETLLDDFADAPSLMPESEDNVQSNLVTNEQIDAANSNRNRVMNNHQASLIAAAKLARQTGGISTGQYRDILNNLQTIQNQSYADYVQDVRDADLGGLSNQETRNFIVSQMDLLKLDQDSLIRKYQIQKDGVGPNQEGKIEGYEDMKLSLGFRPGRRDHDEAFMTWQFQNPEAWIALQDHYSFHAGRVEPGPAMQRALRTSLQASAESDPKIKVPRRAMRMLNTSERAVPATELELELQADPTLFDEFNDPDSGHQLEGRDADLESVDSDPDLIDAPDPMPIEPVEPIRTPENVTVPHPLSSFIDAGSEAPAPTLTQQHQAHQQAAAESEAQFVQGISEIAETAAQRAVAQALGGRLQIPQGRMSSYQQIPPPPMATPSRFETELRYGTSDRDARPPESQLDPFLDAPKQSVGEHDQFHGAAYDYLLGR